MARTEEIDEKDMPAQTELDLVERPLFKVGEEYHAFPDAARGIETTVTIQEIIERNLENLNTVYKVSDGRTFTRDQLLTKDEAKLLRKAFSKKKFVN